MVIPNFDNLVSRKRLELNGPKFELVGEYILYFIYSIRGVPLGLEYNYKSYNYFIPCLTGHFVLQASNLD